MLTFSTFLGLCFSGVNALCPFAHLEASNTEAPIGHYARSTVRRAPEGYFEAFNNLNFDDIKRDLRELFVNSQDFWPADYGNYGPLLIRLAWHQSGSYRTSDGRGGSDGGQMRFEPERSWDDNVNLDKARRILRPIKLKYGLGLSWGDLMILAGNTAIESMGGPVLGFCGGRVDDVNGFWTQRLGPTEDQTSNTPCDTPGACTTPFGTNQVGLIYVNPEGPRGNPVPSLSAPQVRSTFARMGMNDAETVALVGGGHAFGKVHGACPLGAGQAPRDNPLNPWAGNCGTGVGVDTFSSGFEGPWTATPTEWNNEYYHNLLDYPWEKWTGPGGHYQWRVPANHTEIPHTTLVNGTGRQDIQMLTADLSLIYDANYRPLVTKYRNQQWALDDAFSKAWYKLTTRDMGPVTRCLGDMVPEPQPFQGPLPDAPEQLADFDEVKRVLRSVLTTEQHGILQLTDGTYGPELIRLAFRCAATFRQSDYSGGCNGARIRMAPQIGWSVNSGLDRVLRLLDDVKEQFGESLSWADLIVLAGNVAMESAGSKPLTFCGGRTDAPNYVTDVISPNLEWFNNLPIVKGEMTATKDDLEQWTLLLGLDAAEFTAIMGARALGRIFGVHKRLDRPTKLSSMYYKSLTNLQWIPSGNGQYYKAKWSSLNMRRDDVLLVIHPEYFEHVQTFASDESAWLKTLARAWTKLMNSDRFDGPTGNVCDVMTTTQSPSMEESNGLQWYHIAIIVLCSVIVLGMAAFAVRIFCSRSKSSSNQQQPDGAVQHKMPVFETTAATATHQFRTSMSATTAQMELGVPHHEPSGSMMVPNADQTPV